MRSLQHQQSLNNELQESLKGKDQLIEELTKELNTFKSTNKDARVNTLTNHIAELKESCNQLDQAYSILCEKYNEQSETVTLLERELQNMKDI